MKVLLPHKFRLFLNLSLITLFIFSPFGFNLPARAAKSPSNLQAELKKVEDELKKIRADREQVAQRISSETRNQSKLQGDAKYIENIISQNELQQRNLELEIEKLNIEIKILEEEKEKSENRLKEIQDKLSDMNNDLIHYTNLLYKISLTTPNFLSENIKFEDSVLNEEKINSLVRIVKSDVESIKKLEAEAIGKRDEIAAKKKEVDEKQAEMKAQNENLNVQIQGLAWQRENKLLQIEQSKKQQIDLTQKKNDIDVKIMEFEQKVANLRNSLYSLPPSGTRVAAGQVIGFQGRSGLSCDPLMPGIVKTNNYCEKYGGTGPNWYYYDPVQYPSKGSHLHFEYYKNGTNVYPYNYLFDQNSREFVSKPYQPFSTNNFSRGAHGYNAIDLYSVHGAPIYAVKSGLLRYYCINYPPVPGFPDPAYGAIIYHDDGTRSQYWHMQRRGAPCTYL